MTHHPLTLFIVKRFHGYAGSVPISNGLKNSARFVVEMLLREGHRAKLVEAIDGNCIDRLVTEHRPARVVLEAIWVTPAKLAELKRLHPAVQWTVRIHSEVPFLANEGVAVEWIAAFVGMGVEVAFNSAQTVDDFSVFGRVGYLPNTYPLRQPRARRPAGETVHIGCFGAIRPLKNQLIQSMAAVRYAATLRRPLVLHMNGSRIEQAGHNNLRNIRALLEATGGTLALHPWLDHEEFLELLCGMDLCLQVSLSESFNIVSADAVSMGIPLIGSPAVRWLPKRSCAEPGSAASIVAAMARADDSTVRMNHAALEAYLEDTVRVWNDWMWS